MREELCLSAAAAEAPAGVLFHTPSNAVWFDTGPSPLTQESGTRHSAAPNAAAAKRPAVPGRRLVQHTCTPLAASLARRQRGAATEATGSCNTSSGTKPENCPSSLSWEGPSSRLQEMHSGPAARLVDEAYSSPPADSIATTEDEELAAATLAQQRDGLSSGSSTSPYHRVNVKVLVRCRPMTKEERRNGCSVVDVAPEKKELTVRLRRGSSLRSAAFSASGVAAGNTQKPTLLQNSLSSSTSSSSAPAGLGIGLSKVFRFDGVCPLNYTQQDLFEEHVRPLVDEVIQGFNCTVFAYGQTGTGKTFTIEGAAPASPRSYVSNGDGENLDSFPPSSPNFSADTSVVAAVSTSGTVPSKTPAVSSLPKAPEDMEGVAFSLTKGAAAGAEDAQNCALVACSSMTKRSAGEPNTISTVLPASDCGLIPRAVDHIFTTLRQQKDSEDFMVSCSFLEIYNEELIDLFAASTPAPVQQQGGANVKSASVTCVSDTQTVAGASKAFHTPDAPFTTAGGSFSSRSSSSSTGTCASPLLTMAGCRLRIYEEPATAAASYAPCAASTAESSLPGVTGVTPITAAGRAGGGAACSRLQQSDRGVVKVEGLVEKEVKSAEEVFTLLRAAAPRRAFARSSMNIHSSRSHTVFSISVCVREPVRGEDPSLVTAEPHRSSSAQSRCMSTTGSSSSSRTRGGISSGAVSIRTKEGPAETTRAAGSAGRGRRRGSEALAASVGERTSAFPTEEVFRVGKLNLVDLAGSENVYRSWGTGAAKGAAAGGGGGNAEEKRRRECTLINKSLLTLGRCINALVEHASYIPYRDSKLTRLLQDSLGGCTKTCLIATISPAEDVVEETLNTLNYASRAKNIQNLPVKTLRHSKSSLLSSLLAQNQQLQLLLASQRERDGVFLPVPLFQQHQQEHLLLVQQSQEQQRDILSLQRQVDGFQAAEQRLQQTIDAQGAQNEQLQQQTRQLQNALVATEQREQQLEQQLQAVQQQRQTLLSRLREKLQQHIFASAKAASDLRKAHEEASLLDRHRCLLQEREQHTRDMCEGLAAGADVAHSRLQQHLQKLHEQLQDVLVSLGKNEATRAEAGAIEETLVQTQQQKQLRLQQEQQQRRADALLQLQHQQQTKRKDRDDQLDILINSLTQFAAACKQLRTETATRGNMALQEVRKKQQHVAAELQATLLQQLEQGNKASTELQQLLQESSSTHAAEAKQTCMSLRQLAQQVDEWHLQQQRLVEERAAAVAAAVGHQLSKFAQEQRVEVEEHSRNIQQRLQQMQQVILQRREEAADQAAAVAAAAAAAGESAATLAKTGEIGASHLLKEAEHIQAAAAAAERDKSNAADQAAASQCDQLQRQIKAVSASDEATEKDFEAGLHRVLLDDKEAHTSAAAAAASNAEARKQQRRHTQKTTAAATVLLQEASAAAAALHGGCKMALTEQHTLVKKCTTHILTQVLQPQSCVRGPKCLMNRPEQPESEKQCIDNNAVSEAAFSCDACKQKSSGLEDRKGRLEGEQKENDAADVSSLCSWCAAAAAAHWLMAPDGPGTAAVAQAMAAAAAAAKDAVAADAFGKEVKADNQPSVEATIHTQNGTPIETGVHRVAAKPEDVGCGLADDNLLTDVTKRMVPAWECVSAELPVDHSPPHEKRKENERVYRTEEASEFPEKTPLLQERATTGVGAGENLHDETTNLLVADGLRATCGNPQKFCHWPEAARETLLRAQLISAQQRSSRARTNRSSSRDNAVGSTERSHEAVSAWRKGTCPFSSSKSMDRSLPSRSTTSSSTPCCSSSVSRNSSSRRKEHFGEKSQIHKGKTQGLVSRESQTPSQNSSETEDVGSPLQARHQPQEQNKQQQECGDVKEAKACATPLESPFQEHGETTSLQKSREQSQQSHQLHRQHSKPDKQLQQRGASRLKLPLVELLPFAKKHGAEEATSKSQQERSARLEMQQQRQHEGRHQTGERRQLLRSSKSRMHHYQQQKKLQVQKASLGGAGEDTVLSNVGSGSSRNYAREGKASLSHPAPQPSLRRSRSGENVAHSEADKRKKVHDEATGETIYDTLHPIRPAA